MGPLMVIDRIAEVIGKIHSPGNGIGVLQYLQFLLAQLFRKEFAIRNKSTLGLGNEEGIVVFDRGAESFHRILVLRV